MNTLLTIILQGNPNPSTKMGAAAIAGIITYFLIKALSNNKKDKED